jgi:sulfatase modifying factor 1
MWWSKASLMNSYFTIIICAAFLHGSLALQAQSTVQYVLVQGGTYQVGKKGDAINPLRMAFVNTFKMSTKEVTNRQFFEFVTATGYMTEAERFHNAMVYVPGAGELEWKADSSANWRHPNGRGKDSIYNKMDHPVVCISYMDALVYCKWAGVRLPNVDEWEVASRAGSDKDYFFGDDGSMIVQYANIGSGSLPKVTDSNMQILFTTPVGYFKPSSNGLFDIYGNAAELCSGKLPTNKTEGILHVRGGSWRCGNTAGNLCNSYKVDNANRKYSYSTHGFRVIQ